ncbi:MAG: hypothetical protein EXR43_01555 [Dehalococcoidia bacterium]|nr:hypothetical protein [Dehalococcoidia bacterium]
MRMNREHGALACLYTPAGAGALAVGLSTAALAVKLTVGLLTGSIAVLSDAVDSGQDLLAAGVTLFSVRLAMRPASDGIPTATKKWRRSPPGLKPGSSRWGRCHPDSGGIARVHPRPLRSDRAPDRGAAAAKHRAHPRGSRRQPLPAGAGPHGAGRSR